MDDTSRKFLIVGTMRAEGAFDYLKSASIPYVHKLLASNPGNWKLIAGVIREVDTIGIIVKLNASAFRRFYNYEYREIGRELICALSTKPHLVFIHEDTFEGRSSSSSFDDGQSDEEEEYWRGYLYPPASDAERQYVLSLLRELDVNISVYRRNAELSIIASDFVSDVDKNLVLRVYIPSDRLFANETDRVIDLFQQWMHEATSLSVRKDVSRTRSGRIYEFYGERGMSQQSLFDQVDQFQRFLDNCVDSPDDALRQLAELGLGRDAAYGVVARYEKEGKRLRLDLKQTKEKRLLDMKHALESELHDSTDLADGAKSVGIDGGEVRDLLSFGFSDQAITPILGSVTINVGGDLHQTSGQVVNYAVVGLADLSLAAREALSFLVGAGAGPEIQGAVYELEDPEIDGSKKAVAKSRVLGFLKKAEERLSAVGVGLVTKYLESKMGL